jgi:hypothetical protein
MKKFGFLMMVLHLINKNNGVAEKLKEKLRI